MIRLNRVFSDSTTIRLAGILAMGILLSVFFAASASQAQEHDLDVQHETTTHTAGAEEHAAGEAATHGAESGEHGAEGEHHEAVAPNIFWVLPFIVLLLCIAILPLIHSTEEWWEKNSSKLIVALTLSVVTCLYYLFREHGFHADPGFKTNLRKKFPAHRQGRNFQCHCTA